MLGRGNDIISAKEMYAALVRRPVKGTTASVNEINESVTKLEVNKVQNFSSFHNFQYENEGDVRVWKAFGVGQGKKISSTSIYVSHQENTKLQVKTMFPHVQIQRQTTSESPRAADSSNNEENNDLFDCPEHGCNCTFSTFDDLEVHLDVGQHHRFINNEGVYDTLRREWARNFTTVTGSASSTLHKETTLLQGQCHLEMGWALSKARSGSARFPPNVRQYLVKKFDYGERTGHKCDPVQTSLDMRHAMNESGQRIFKREEWLTAQQIKGVFSRLAKTQRKSNNKNVDAYLKNLDLEEDQLESDGEENELREELISSITNEINIIHPIFYDAYDLCELHREQRLAVFKVVMPRQICEYFELQFKSKDKKIDLIDNISSMVEKCSCHKA